MGTASCGHAQNQGLARCVRQSTETASTGVIEYTYAHDGYLLSQREYAPLDGLVGETWFEWETSSLQVRRKVFGHDSITLFELGPNGELLRVTEGNQTISLRWEGQFTPAAPRRIFADWQARLGERWLPLNTTWQNPVSRMRAFAFTGTVTVAVDNGVSEIATYQAGRKLTHQHGTAMTQFIWDGDQLRSIEGAHPVRLTYRNDAVTSIVHDDVGSPYQFSYVHNELRKVTSANGVVTFAACE